MLRLDVPIEMAALADAQARIEAYLLAQGAPQSLILRVRLVVEELLVNLVMHGRFAGPPPAARVAVALAGSTAQVTIEDAAAPFDPRQGGTPPAAPGIAEAPLGGLGLALVRQMAGIQAYAPIEGGWNRTVLAIRPD